MKLFQSLLLLSMSAGNIATAFMVVKPAARIAHPARHAAGDDVDYDAPSQRAAAVGNVVKAPEMKVRLGPLQVPLPDFIAKAFMEDDRASVNEDLISLLDDECYLGKDGNLDECADFDPDHSTSV